MAYLLAVHLSPHVLAQKSDDFQIICEETPAHIKILTGTVNILPVDTRSFEILAIYACARLKRQLSIARLVIDETSFMDEHWDRLSKCVDGDSAFNAYRYFKELL